MESHGWVDALGVVLANTFARKDMCEMRFSAEEREYEQIEVLHKKRKEFQSTWRMMAVSQFSRVYENDDPIEHDLLERENKGEFIKNPADQYEISITSASADITARERMSSEELQQFLVQEMTFRPRDCNAEDVEVNSELSDGSTAAATKAMSFDTVISMTPSSTSFTHGASLHRNTAPTHLEHNARAKATEDAVRLLNELQEQDSDNTVAIERVTNFFAQSTRHCPM